MLKKPWEQVNQNCNKEVTCKMQRLNKAVSVQPSNQLDPFSCIRPLKNSANCSHGDLAKHKIIELLL
jgi:hypothetical protein